MKINKILIMLLTFISLTAIVNAVCPSDGDTINVNTTLNSSDFCNLPNGIILNESVVFDGNGATINGTGGSSGQGVKMGDNSTLMGLTITNHNIGVAVLDADNVVIHNNTISDSTQIGVYMTDNRTNMTITDNEIYNTGTSSAIFLFDDGSVHHSENIIITGNLLDGGGSDGMLITSADEVLIDNNTILNMTANGIYMRWCHNYTVSNNLIDGISQYDGMWIRDSSPAYTGSEGTVVIDNTIMNTGLNGITATDVVAGNISGNNISATTTYDLKLDGTNLSFFEYNFLDTLFIDSDSYNNTFIASQNYNTTDNGVGNDFSGICAETWLPQYTVCNISDNQTLFYVDNNSCGTTDFFPADNGTVSVCNYCSADYDSNPNGCGGYTYTWNNYDTCCAVTGIEADCTIPINETCDACGTPTISSITGDTVWLYGNDCISIRMRKIYNPNVEINTSLLNTIVSLNRHFKLIVHGLEEREVGSDNIKKYHFKNKDFTSDITQGYVRYVSDDITIGYIVQDETFKTVMTITNFSYFYGDSILWQKVFYLKDTEDVITYTAPIVDSVTQPVVVEYGRELNDQADGYNDFAYQKLGRGALIFVDPIFSFPSWTGIHSASDIPALIIDFGVEFGITMVGLAGIVVLIGLLAWFKGRIF